MKRGCKIMGAIQELSERKTVVSCEALVGSGAVNDP